MSYRAPYRGPVPSEVELVECPKCGRYTEGPANMRTAALAVAMHQADPDRCRPPDPARLAPVPDRVSSLFARIREAVR